MDARLSEFWSLPIERLLEALESSAQGLSDAGAMQRLATYGANAVAPPSGGGAWRRVAAQFTSPITVLLLIAAILSVGMGEATDGTIILGILVVSGSLSIWQEHRASSAIDQLLALVRINTTVTRAGVTRDVPIEAVVPGDIVQLVAGDVVPGDARLIDAHDLFVDQAVLTGESYPAEKTPGIADAAATLAERMNTLYLGTHVVSGTATAVVVHTGRATVFGEMAYSMNPQPPETEFEHGIRRFGYLLLEVTTVLVICIFAINVALDRPVLDALLFTLALAVGLTPQLLPAIVSITLAQGARHMAAKRVIVRRLASIEDLGGMEILCTDKTGTITEGIVSIQTAEDWTGAPSERAGLFAYLNAAFETGFPNPIDMALRATAHADAAKYTKLDEVPYDFVRKRLSVVVSDGTRHLLITKGALSAVLDICDSAESADGSRVALEEARGKLDARYRAISSYGHRCLGIAYRELQSAEPIHRSDERGMTFAGMLTFADPLKPHAAESLQELASLGIRVVLVTGDNRHVAARMAAEAGLDASALCAGSDLTNLSSAALASAAPRINVFAEVGPVQKEQIILALKRAHYAVGYLGDGVNDAAALLAADVGISVDSAADVTKRAADIVLLEKDLSVLGRGVREGRRAFANTLKYVFITTSANFGNMFSMAGASLFAAFLPLLPKQILLINVLTDLPAMAVATDRLDPELVERPRRWDTQSIRRFMITFGLVSSIFDYLTFGILYALHVPAVIFRTAWFVESVLSEIFVLLVIRTRRAFFRSRPGTALFWLSVVVGGATVAMPYSPVASLFGFGPLPGYLFGIVIGVVVLYVVGSEATKRVIFRRVPM